MAKYTVSSPGDDSECCEHDFKPHVLVMLNTDDIAGTEGVPVGGLMFCPSCDCTATWSVKGYPVPELPGPGELAEMREEALHE
jgi:hypothetical protein